MAPLRVPERAVESLAGAVQVLSQIRSDLSAVRDQTAPLGELVPLTREIRRQVEPMPYTVERISAQAEPLAELLPTLERLEQGIEHRLAELHQTMQALERDECSLNEKVDGLGREIEGMHQTICGLKEDVERVTARLPDPARGPLEKARDVLTGTGDSGPGSRS